jgi:acyl carrier protein
MLERIREIIRKHAHLAVDLASLSDDADLWVAGMTSFANVDVMLALEDTFHVEFPDRMLLPDTFKSVSAIHSALDELGVEAPV